VSHLALAQAGTAPNQIGHFGIRRVFGSMPTPISVTKSATGLMSGVAGCAEAIFAVPALRDQTVPPTLNLCGPGTGASGLDLVGPEARPWRFDHAASNRPDGVNARLPLRGWREQPTRPA